MEEEIIVPERRKPFVLFAVIEWISCGFVAFFIFLLALDSNRLAVQGAPVALYLVAILAFAATAIALSPPLFFRLPTVGKVLAYVGILASLILLVVYIRHMDPVWDRTPAGKRQLAERAARERLEAAQRAAEVAEEARRERGRQQLAELESTQRQLEEIQERLESCFSWSHQLPDLTDAVRNSLHNPDSFEHVETVLIVPDDDRNNVVMRFRAENGYGAIRTAIVRAQLVSDDQGCTVQNIGQPISD